MVLLNLLKITSSKYREFPGEYWEENREDRAIEYITAFLAYYGSVH